MLTLYDIAGYIVFVLAACLVVWLVVQVKGGDDGEGNIGESTYWSPKVSESYSYYQEDKEESE